MKFSLRGASSAAIIVGMSSALPMWAQQASDAITTNSISGPQQAATQVDQTSAGPAAQGSSSERVVVTGSLIQGTPEDAALPVEVFTNEELEEQGAPTALEFVKNLTISGPTTGEAYYFGGAASTGSPSFNLRGIGADKTLTLLNGRRVSENAANIPSIAVARTEILKDGAAVTYGADATGGVVNFITRDGFTGLEMNAQYKAIDSSDGDYSLGILGGFGEGDTNFMWSAEWEHRSRLNTLDRPDITDPAINWDGTTLADGSPNGNPAPWSTLTNLAGWLPLGSRPGFPADNTRTGEFGSPLAGIQSDFTPASCAAVGGVYRDTFTCRYNYIPYYNLVEDQDTYRVFAQLDTVVTDDIDFHADFTMAVVDVPEVYGSPSQPVVQGPARATGATFQYLVPITNPYVAEFAARSGLDQAATFPFVQGLSPVTYRPLAHGGNPVLGGGGTFGVPSRINNQIWRMSSGLSGRVGDWAGPLADVNFDISGTFNQQNFEGDAADVLAYRLQEALQGFGGPNCNVPDLDPLQFGTQNPGAAGQNGCLWWNPFASAFPNQPQTGAVNPSYVAGFENDPSLYNWLVDPRKTESQTQSITIDAVFSGDTPIELPGGAVAWGVGTQWRQVEFKETVRSDFFNGKLACVWPTNFTTGIDTDGDGNPEPVPQLPLNPSDPLYTGCTPDEPGPFNFFATNIPDASDRQQFSYFGELNIPLHDRVNLTAAVRREDFSGGLGATVYKVSGKWDVFGPVSIRGSYGTNYQAPPLGIVPGEVQNLVRSYDRAGGNWRAFQRTTDSGLQPETATAWNAGILWQSQGFAPDHDFNFFIDYFDIETEDEIGDLATHNQILFEATGGAGGTQLANGFWLIDCSNPFVTNGRVRFNNTPTSPNGSCVQGQTNTDDFAVVTSVQGNAFGQHTAGIDFNATYRMPVGAGDLTLNVTGTKVTEIETSERVLDGIQLAAAEDRLGFLNFSTVGVAAPELRVNTYAAYRLDRHTFRLQHNYISAVEDERAGIQYGEMGEDWNSTDLFYLFDLTDTLRLSASIVNIADQMPAGHQVELGYDPRAGGNALGRTFEVGVKKTF